MNFEGTYTPLSHGLTIQPASHGLGLVATETIPAGTFLGISHIWEVQRSEWIRTPLGGFINHSDKPNAKGDNRIKDGVDYRILIITEDVKAGDEITFFYTLDEYKGVSFKTNRL